MRTYIIEFTCFIFRADEEVEAHSEAEAREKFLADSPGIAGGNGRIVSVRLKGEKPVGSFQQRLDEARRNS